MRMQIARAFLVFGVCCATANGGETSASKVKATATASKLTADGKQTVTITLDIATNRQVFANPVGLDVLEDAQTTVRITAKVKPAKVTVAYPKGTMMESGKFKFNVYKGTVQIRADVQRGSVDRGPLEIVIDTQTWGIGVCDAPTRIKLTIP